jgi:hypothetical protein
LTGLCFFVVIFLKLLFTVFQDFVEGHNLFTPPFTPFPLLRLRGLTSFALLVFKFLRNPKTARSPSTLAIGELPIGGTHLLEAVVDIRFYSITRKNIMFGFRITNLNPELKFLGFARPRNLSFNQFCYFFLPRLFVCFYR